MREYNQGSLDRIHGAGAALILGLLVVCASPAKAAPFTDNFAALTADLQTRAGTLSNSTDKTEQKQFKAIQKVLTSLQANDSPSLATDIKNAGKIAKSLVKTFPVDFTPPGSSLSTNLTDTLQGLADGVHAAGGSIQTNIDALAASVCKVKAQAGLDTAQALLDEAAAATDFATAAKLIGSALKSVLKAGKTADGCTSGGGGGGGDFMKATISGDFSLNFSSSGPLPVTATYTSSIKEISVLGEDTSIGGVGIGVVALNVTGPGSYPLFAGTNVVRANPNKQYGPGVGTVTFTTFDPANQKAAGTFSFTAGSITATNGSFSVTKIQVF